MTLGQLKEATCSPTSCAEKFFPFIIETCGRYEINTPVRKLCFLAHVGHESGGLFYTEELASGAAYEGRKSLGNTQPGDGISFKGRGLIQITGRANYESIGNSLGVDFITSPTLLGGKNIKVCTANQLKYAALSAGWFWSSRKLNTIADLINIKSTIDGGSNLENFKILTKKINGGLNGLHDRLNRYKTGQKYF
ncbi:MAG: glycoside hydrolase family 19 protein [Ginsengibacter sp.]